MLGETLSEHFTRVTILYAPRLGSGVLVLVGFWVAAVLLQKGVLRLASVRRADPDLAGLLGRATKITILVLGLVTALGTLGINVTAIVAGLGLTGFALGFALKDVISNSLAGILLLLYKPIQREHRITVAGFTGDVKQIDVRYTILAVQEQTIFVPNSLLFTNAITVHEPSADHSNAAT